MSSFKLSLVAALLAIVGTAGGLHFFQQGRAREASRLQAENNRMLAEANQRQQASMAAGRSAASSPGAVNSAAANPAAAPASAPAEKPADYYRNEGNATPLATLQTFAWACDRGDIETVGRLLHIDAAARPKAEAFMAALPAEVRSQWKTVDAMAAALLTRSIMASPFPNSDILETATPEPISEGRVRLRLPDIPKDGTEYQQTAEGWKYVLTETVVDAYINQARAQAGAGR